MSTFGPLLLDSAEMDLKAGRFERARDCLRRYLAANGDSARAYFILGETCRQDHKKADIAKAREYYLKSSLLDPAYADPHRALGLLAYKQNDREQARKSLERYLALSATAPDRRYIEEMLQSIR
jgi:tetratricopeptide (TPR) repeat protein